MRQLIQKNTLLIALICMTTLAYAQRKKKNSLKGHAVEKIDAKVGAKEGIGPGTSLEFGISAKLEDGSYMNTTGLLKGKVKWSDFKFEVQGGSYVHYPGSSNIVITGDQDKIINHEVVVQVTSVYHPSLKSTLKIPLNYKLSYVANFSGDMGQAGERGAAGSNGTNRDRDEKQTGKGKTGGDGGDGQDGRNGKDGMDGPEIAVRIALAEDAPEGATLLKITIQSGNSEEPKVYLIDGTAGSLKVKANGGDGGAGGTGGDGGTAGWGQSVPTSIAGSEGGDGGTGGNGGNGGDGGDGGNGGRITVSCDAAAKPFLHVIEFEANGGSPGSSGNKGSGGSGGTSGQGYKGGKGGPGGKAGSTHGSAGVAGQDGLVKFEK